MLLGGFVCVGEVDDCCLCVHTVGSTKVLGSNWRSRALEYHLLYFLCRNAQRVVFALDQANMP